MNIQDVFLVCEGTGGAHEASAVYSVWTDRHAAIAEARRLSKLYPDAEIEIAYVAINESHNDATITDAPAYWMDFADVLLYGGGGMYIPVTSTRPRE